uniref:Powder tolerance-related protein n=1 Tax=Triticum aestivum TaxID=4565 RepID=Q7XBC2_WHEAT|nr:wheat powder tolerance-related protein [Triticum aestivum]
MPMVAGEHALDVDGVVAVAAEERLASKQKTMAAIARVFPEEDEASRASPIVTSVHDGGRRLAISFLIGWMCPR